MSSSLQELIRPIAVIVDGAEREGTGPVTEHIDPSTGRVLMSLRLGVVADIDEAVAIARRTQPAWSQASVASRQAVLHRIAELVAASGNDTAHVAAVESGVAVSPAKPSTGPNPAASFIASASRLDGIEGEVERVFPMSGFDYIRREPDGVVGILASSVAPFASAAAALAAAVAAGNCVVMIASGAAPFTPIRLAQLCHLAGLPPGVVNVVVGDEELATQLACRQGLDKICVSGSSADGRRTLVAAASQVRPVLLQLQGMSVDLVFPDADLAAVAASICRALVAASAAGRDVPSRVVVADSCHDDLVACLINELQRLVVGPACSPDTDVGPRPTAAHLERLAAAWARVEQAGGRVFSGARPSDVVNGGRPSGVHAGGWFAWPALATGLGAGEVAGFEDLGVLLSVIPFNCEEDAIALASAAPHTTLARLHTTNLERTHTVTAEIPVPAVVVGLDDIDRGSQPFTVDDFLHRKNVFVDLSA